MLRLWSRENSVERQYHHIVHREGKRRWTAGLYVDGTKLLHKYTGKCLQGLCKSLRSNGGEIQITEIGLRRRLVFWRQRCGKQTQLHTSICGLERFLVHICRSIAPDKCGTRINAIQPHRPDGVSHRFYCFSWRLEPFHMARFVRTECIASDETIWQRLWQTAPIPIILACSRNGTMTRNYKWPRCYLFYSWKMWISLFFSPEEKRPECAQFEIKSDIHLLSAQHYRLSFVGQYYFFIIQVHVWDHESCSLFSLRWEWQYRIWLAPVDIWCDTFAFITNHFLVCSESLDFCRICESCLGCTKW